MAAIPGYKLLADAFIAEGVDTLFALMGDANMHWLAEIAQRPNMRVIHARHEHCACTMADGYGRATGRVGVASVTSGPGYTQIMTALAVATRGNWPMVVFVGDSPSNATWHMQHIEQRPLAVATGARFVAVRSADRLLDCVREAFHTARLERCPVVLSIPSNLQKETFPWIAEYQPSDTCMPTEQRLLPDPAMIDQVADMLAAAKHPIIVAGRGALHAGPALRELAAQSGALLGTSLLAKGLFDEDPYSIGIAGSYGTAQAHEEYATCDLLLGVGAGLGNHTTEAGYLCPDARVVQIDAKPRGLHQGLRVADLYVRSDSREAAEAIRDRLRQRGLSAQGARSPELASRIQATRTRPDDKEYPRVPGLLDPREAMREINEVVPKDWDIIFGAGHHAGFAAMYMQGRPAERYHVINDFAAIGSVLSAAIGIAAARGDGKVLLIDGDGSIMMHVQEMDTARRHGLRLLACVLNDGGYGAEFHKLRAQGMEAREALHGRGDLAAVARGFGWRGEQVTEHGGFAKLFEAHRQAGQMELWDIHTDDAVVSPGYRRVHYGEA